MSLLFCKNECKISTSNSARQADSQKKTDVVDRQTGRWTNGWTDGQTDMLVANDWKTNVKCPFSVQIWLYLGLTDEQADRDR